MSILNWGQSALQSLANAMSEILTFIPRIIGCLVLLLIGWLVGMVVEKVLTVVLRKVGFDRLSDRIGLTRMTQRMGMRMDAAKLLGRVAFWFIFLIFLVPAAQALDVPAISNMLTLIYGYLPNVFAAIVVLLLGALIAHY